MKFLLGKFFDRREGQFSEFDLGSFGLQGDLPPTDSAVAAVIHQVTVNPDLYLILDAFDFHFIPFSNLFFRAVRQIENSPGFSFGDAPVFFRTTSFDHVRNLDIFHDAPEITGVKVVHLYFNRLGKHLVERSRR